MPGDTDLLRHSAPAVIAWGFARPWTSLCESVHVLLALNGCLTVCQPGECRYSSTAVLMPPACLPRVDFSGRYLLIGCVDLSTSLARALLERLDDRIMPLDEDVIIRFGATLPWLHCANCEMIDTWTRSAIVDRLAKQHQPHPAVRRVLEYVRHHELDSGHTSLAHLARVADLSPSRLMPVFTESMYVPLRPYFSWLRLQRAIEALGDGRSVTESAHLAGFADGPHLARTCRRIFGVTPGALAARAGACLRG